MQINNIVHWSGWIITILSFLVNIIQYFRFKDMNSRYEDIRKNASVVLEGIKRSLTDSIEQIERSSPPPQAEIAISSLKGCAKSVVVAISSWLDNYGLKKTIKMGND